MIMIVEVQVKIHLILNVKEFIKIHLQKFVITFNVSLS